MSLKYAAAYMMAVLAGNDSPSAGDIQKILESVEVECDSSVAEKLVSELSGQTAHEIIKEAPCMRSATAPSPRSWSPICRARPCASSSRTVLVAHCRPRHGPWPLCRGSAWYRASSRHGGGARVHWRVEEIIVYNDSKGRPSV